MTGVKDHYSPPVKYVARIGIAVSVLINVILGGASNQTFSARNWSLKRKGKPNLVWLIDTLTRDNTHCLESWTYWRVRKYVIHELDREYHSTTNPY